MVHTEEKPDSLKQQSPFGYIGKVSKTNLIIFSRTMQPLGNTKGPDKSLSSPPAQSDSATFLPRG